MRTWTGVCLASVLLVLTSGCGTQTEPAATPRRPPPTLPYLAAGALHADGAALPTTADQVLVSDGTTLVGQVREDGSRWWLLDRGRLVPVLDEATSVVPVLSADGGTAAWTAGGWLAAYDVPTRTALGHVRVAAQVRVAVVADDGRVGLQQPGRRGVLVWRAGDEPAPASWRDFGGHVPDGGVVSPDETLVAGPALEVRDRRTGARVVLDLPADHRWYVAAWEDDAHVLVARGLGDPEPDVRRCDAATGACDG